MSQERPTFVLAAGDPLAPWTVRRYANKARETGATAEAVEEIFAVADEMERWTDAHGYQEPAPAIDPVPVEAGGGASEEAPKSKRGRKSEGGA